MSASASAIRAGRAFVEIFADDSKLNQTLRGAQAKLKAFGKAVGDIGQNIALAGSAVLAPLTASVKVFTDFGDSLAKASQRTGILVEPLSALSYAAGQSGADMETLEGGIRKMQKTITEASDGSKAANDALAALGLTATDLSGQSPEEAFKTLAEQVAAVDDPTRRAALAMEVFGKSGTKLLPLMADGRKGIEALEEQARRFGQTMSDEDAQAAVVLGDTLDDLRGSMRSLMVQVGAALAPTLTKLAVNIREVVATATNWVKQNQQAIVSMLSTAAKAVAFGIALKTVGTAAMAVNSVLGLMQSAIKGVRIAMTFLAAHPVVAALAAIAAVAIAVAAAFGLAADAARDLTLVQKELMAEGDQQRADDLQRMRRLEQLADKQKLNNRELAEAKGIVASLTDTYGDLGLSVDEATGKIEGMTDAQQNLNAAMKQVAIAQMERRIQEIEFREIPALIEDLDDSESWLSNVLPGGRSRGDAQSKQSFAQIEAAVAERVALQARIDALKAGDDSALVPVDKEAAERAKLAAAIAGEEGAQAEAAREAADAAKRLNDIEEQMFAKRRDRLQQEINDIEKLGEERKKLIDAQIAATDDPVERGMLELARKNADAWTRMHVGIARDRAEEEETARAEEKRKGAANTLGEEIERLEIESKFTGKEREKALLEMERRRALAAGAEVGLDPDQINRKFDLQKQMLDLEPPKQNVTGTFNAAAAARLGGDDVQKQQLDQLKRLAQIDEDLLREAKRERAIVA